MVDLIALVVGALTLPNIVAEAFLDALIKGLGITVASGMIKNAVTDTVSCIKTQYTWNLVDTTAASHTHCYHQTMSYYNSGASTPFRTDTDYYQAVGG